MEEMVNQGELVSGSKLGRRFIFFGGLIWLLIGLGIFGWLIFLLIDIEEGAGIDNKGELIAYVVIALIVSVVSVWVMVASQWMKSAGKFKKGLITAAVLSFLSMNFLGIIGCLLAFIGKEKKRGGALSGGPGIGLQEQKQIDTPIKRRFR